jgi:hypothetical protein
VSAKLFDVTCASCRTVLKGCCELRDDPTNPVHFLLVCPHCHANIETEILGADPLAAPQVLLYDVLRKS